MISLFVYTFKISIYKIISQRKNNRCYRILTRKNMFGLCSKRLVAARRIPDTIMS